MSLIVPDLVLPKAIPDVYPRRLREGCVLDLDMQDIGGKIIDHSGFSNHGTNYGSTPVAGPNGWVRNFDGTDDYLNCGNQTNLDITTTLTMIAIVKAASAAPANSGTIIRKIGAGPEGYYFKQTGNTNTIIGELYNAGVGQVFAPGIVLDLQKWTHVIITFNGDKIRSYKNGILRHDLSSSLASIGITTASLHVGGLPGSEPFYGDIAYIAVYNKALPAAEIEQIFQEEAWRYGI